jgi:hypothetical protein
MGAMESRPLDDAFDFELVDVCTDDEYEFVEAAVAAESHVAPPAAPAQPVATAAAGGGDQAFHPPGREAIGGCDDTETIVQSPHGAAAVRIRYSSPQPRNADATEEKTVVQNPVQVEDEAKPDAAPSPARGVTAAVVPAALPPYWYPSPRVQLYGQADQYDEEDDEDEYDGLYESCYDFEDFGRSRNGKRGSGRRGRTKKKALMGRPRGEERSLLVAGNW